MIAQRDGQNSLHCPIPQQLLYFFLLRSKAGTDVKAPAVVPLPTEPLKSNDKDMIAVRF